MTIAAIASLALMAAAVEPETLVPATPEATVAPDVPAAVPPSAAPAPAPSAQQGNSDILVSGRAPSPADPLESVNATSFAVVQGIDKAVIGPVAVAYKKNTPKPLQKGVHHFIQNLDEPIVFVNFLLQLKIGKALETAARFTLNSTVGLGGVLDVAKTHPFHLPRRFNGLADTMGYYGIKSGPYLFLPLIGSTSLRDVTGRMADLSLLPTAVGKPFTQPEFSLPLRVVSAIDDRAQQDDDIRRNRDLKRDGYVAMREFYLKRRQSDIDELRGLPRSDGKPTVDEQLAATWAAERAAKEARKANGAQAVPDPAPLP